ncbi:CRISPR-associated endonuclease Cas1, partial [Acetoanaerobium noterae]|uniref:CRISPR-associated endonuclease Cas1 n=1 Tax=Acetoanaerobium noterae TaxID=745369 RepID=UPI003221CE95
ADSVVLQVLNNQEVSADSFVSRNAGVQLTASGRRAVLTAYERRLAHEIKHPVFGYRITYRRCLEVQTRLMAALFVGEIDEYPPLVTR